MSSSLGDELAPPARQEFLQLRGGSLPLHHADGADWVAVADLAAALNLEIKQLSGGRLGLCPDPLRCIVVPASRVREPDRGGTLVHVDVVGLLADPDDGGT